MITQKSLISFARTIFQLIVACLAMFLSVYYCIDYADTYAKFLNGKLDPDTGGLGFGLLWGMYLYPSLLFLVFSAKWIGKNWIGILCCYFTTVFLINIIVSHLTNKITLIGGFIFQSMMLLPLILLVSTTVHYTVSIFQRWR